MREILGDYAPRIGKSELGYGERNPMFRLIFPVFARVPVETGFGHGVMVSRILPISHIKVWLTDVGFGIATSNVSA